MKAFLPHGLSFGCFQSWLIGAAFCGMTATGFTQSVIEGVTHFDDGFPPAHLKIYYPPTPPALGAVIPTARIFDEIRRPAPAELSAYVNEPFYAPLSSLLAENRLSRKDRTELELYRSTKIALTNELRGRLDALKNADRDARTCELETFAKTQTPRVAELEATAEELREHFIRIGADWNSQRTWWLGEGDLKKPRNQTLAAELQVIQAAVFFAKGFTPTQRRWLREIAIELQESLDPSSAGASGDVKNQPFFFSPDGARLRLPAGTPPELAAKFADWAARKSALRAELRDLVYTQDKTLLERNRIAAFQDLAARQAPRIQELDAEAERLRRQLAAAPRVPLSPTLPPLPPELAERMKTYRKNALALQNQLRERLASATSGSSERQVNERLLAAANQFREENGARFTELQHEHESIRAELTKIAAQLANGDTGRPAQVLLKEFAEAMIAQETWPTANQAAYSDYRTALLEPGLSPEQRRLLFDAAIEALNLPLPNDISPSGLNSPTH